MPILDAFNRYGHLMPGSRDQARELVDRYLAAAVSEGQVAAKSSGERVSV